MKMTKPQVAALVVIGLSLIGIIVFSWLEVTTGEAKWFSPLAGLIATLLSGILFYGFAQLNSNITNSFNQINRNMSDGFNQINRNMSDGFNQINKNIKDGVAEIRAAIKDARDIVREDIRTMREG